MRHQSYIFSSTCFHSLKKFMEDHIVNEKFEQNILMYVTSTRYKSVNYYIMCVVDQHHPCVFSKTPLDMQDTHYYVDPKFFFFGKLGNRNNNGLLCIKKSPYCALLYLLTMNSKPGFVH